MQFDLEEVARHNKVSHAWVIIHGLIYDVTQYLHEHPGGPDLLAEMSGKDATDAFYGIGHSEDAFTILKRYRIGAQRFKGDVSQDTVLHETPISPSEYVPLPLKAKTPVAPNVFRFTFTMPDQGHNLQCPIPIGQHVGMRAVVNGETIARAYTPVQDESDEHGTLTFIIKIYAHGKFTQYLAGLNTSDEVLMRGPVGLMQYQSGLGEQVGMVAGGTGITPIYPIIRAICSDNSDTCKVSLVYLNRTEQDIIFRAELDTLARQCPDKFQVHYILSQPPGRSGFGEKGLDRKTFETYLPGPGNGTRLFLCGPPGMLEAVKGLAAGAGYERPSFIKTGSDQVFVF